MGAGASKTRHFEVDHTSPRESIMSIHQSFLQHNTTTPSRVAETGVIKQSSQPSDNLPYLDSDDDIVETLALKVDTKHDDDRVSSNSTITFSAPANDIDPTQSKDSCLSIIDWIKEAFHCGNGISNQQLLARLGELNMTYSTIAFSQSGMAQYLGGQIIDYMITEGVDDIVFTLVLDILPSTVSHSESSITDLERDVMDEAVGIMQNFTDISEVFSRKVCERPGLLEALAEAMLFRALIVQHIDLENDCLFRSLLGSIYNSSRYYADRKRYKEAGLVWVLKRILKCNSLIWEAAVALAGILDEEESKFFHTEKDAIAVVATLLEGAVQAIDRRYHSFSAKELATACSRLAGNEVNQKLLVEVGILKHLLQLCSVGDSEEQKEALSALWALAYDDENKQSILDTEDMIMTLGKLKDSEHGHAKTESTNILWTLSDKLKSSTNPEFRILGEELFQSADNAASSEKLPTSSKHVMISYSWHDKLTVFQIHDALEKSGYRIWIDRNEMRGSIIDCISSALGNADAMLMCVSPTYKNSKFCRGEAKYAHKHDIPIVPLLMISGYEGDGWLDFIKEDRMHFDFSSMDNFGIIFQALVSELGLRGKAAPDVNNFDEPDSGPGAVTGNVLTHVISGHGAVVSDVINWPAEKVKQWLHDNGCDRLDQRTVMTHEEQIDHATSTVPPKRPKKKSFESLTGRQLLFLKKLQQQAPEYFYNFLKKDMRLREIETLTNFVYALETL